MQPTVLCIKGKYSTAEVGRLFHVQVFLEDTLKANIVPVNTTTVREAQS